MAPQRRNLCDCRPLLECDARSDRQSRILGNLTYSELIEQAAAFSGAADEERASERITEQEEELERLTKTRDLLANGKA
ncbi:hypothetical protein C7U61_12930 [Rhizobium sp. JAB6]|nr:hypothetical protein C7U61_12930 [Rhizobium sp. JAB6]